MQHRSDTNPGTQMLRISSDLDNRVRTCPHQQVIDLAFVLMRDVGNLFGQREDQMEIPHGQQLGLTCDKPCFRRPCLTFGTVPPSRQIAAQSPAGQ